MKIKMILSKETRNYLVYSQTEDGNNAMEDADAVIGKLYLKAKAFKDLPEMITVTIERV